MREHFKLALAIALVLAIGGCEPDGVEQRLRQSLLPEFRAFNNNVMVLASEIWRTNKRVKRLEARIRHKDQDEN